MSSLSNDEILALLADEKQQTTRGPKIDPTLDRSIPTWTKLNHHKCDSGCEHRKRVEGVISPPCWNPNCKDTRKPDDVGREIVVAIKEQYICRYCFLSGYLLDNPIPGIHT